MVFWPIIIFHIKIFTHGHTRTYLKKPLVVGVPFSHGSCTFAPRVEGLFVLLGGMARSEPEHSEGERGHGKIKIRENPG